MWLEAYARIANRDSDLTVVIFVRLYRELTVSARVLHSIDSVKHQVHQNLPELHNVAQDHMEFRRKLGANGDRVAPCLAPQQLNHLANELVYVNRLALRGTFLE